MNVYDFDNTIYDGESCLDFFMFYVRKKPRLLLMLPSVAWAFFRYKLGRVSVEQAIKKYAPATERFIAEMDDIDGDCKEFWDKHIHNIKPFYEKIRQSDDLIITASPDFSMNEICKRLGIVHCLSSVVDAQSGRILRFNLRGEKVKAFFDEYEGCEIDDFYTDSPKNDKPLIDIARRAFVVKGNHIKQIK